MSAWGPREWCWRCEENTRWRTIGHWVVCTTCRISCDYIGPLGPDEEN